MAKAAAAALVAAVTSAVVLAAFWAAVLALASARGIDVPPHLTGYVRDQSLRGVALASAGALGAFAVTMFFRSTVATLGILFGTALVGSLVLAALGVSERWFPHVNVGAWLLDGVRYYVTPPPSCQSASSHLTPECQGVRFLTLRDSATYLGGLLVLAVVMSLAAFRRRDVP